MERPLRVLLAPSAYYPHVGGVEELTRQLALSFLARGHDVTVLTNRWPAGVSERETIGEVEVNRLRFPLPSANAGSAVRFLATAPGAASDLLAALRRSKPDVVHVIGAGPQSVYLGALAAIHRRPLVFTGQGEAHFDATGVFERSATLRAGLRRTVGRACAVTACSAFTLEHLRTVVPLPDTAVVVPNGVDPAEFDKAVPETGLGRYLFAAGRLVRQKGFDVLLDAFARLPADDLRLIIAGDGAERDSLINHARTLGIARRVEMLGAVSRSRLPALMKGAHVFAFPSRGEPFGIALLEAMACGVPSVATAAGGIPEFARHGVNALLVPPGDPVALAGALARILTDDALRGHMSACARTTATDLAWPGIAARYESIYARALADGAV